MLAHQTVCKSPLCNRDALCGCRNESMLLHYNAREGETIQYVDVTSLYPYICKYLKFPVWHPVIHAGDACKDKEACLRKEGLIKCTIVPPETMYHPVLPFRANQKLMFGLCRTCVLTSNTGECRHKTDEERALTGIWVIDDVRIAVQKGYRIREIYELYEYNVTDTNPKLGKVVCLLVI